MESPAEAGLHRRWEALRERYPVGAADISWPKYRRANLRFALRNERHRCAEHGVVYCQACKVVA